LKGLPLLCDRRELTATAIKKIASKVKTHTALHAYARFGPPSRDAAQVHREMEPKP
jgi:hypothetical protein